MPPPIEQIAARSPAAGRPATERPRHGRPPQPAGSSPQAGDTAGPRRVSPQNRAAHRGAACIIAVIVGSSCSTTTRTMTRPAARPGGHSARPATPAASLRGHARRHHARLRQRRRSLRPSRTTETQPSSTPTPPAAPVMLSGGGGAAGAAARRTAARRPVGVQAGRLLPVQRGRLRVTRHRPNGKPTQSFNWTVQTTTSTSSRTNQSGEAQQETLAFSFGPDANSVFLKQPDGNYREYALVKNSDAGGMTRRRYQPCCHW